MPTKTGINGIDSNVAAKLLESTHEEPERLPSENFPLPLDHGHNHRDDCSLPL
jgi:hypothetical protein